MKKKLLLRISLFAMVILMINPAQAQRRMEKLGRGVVAVRTGTSSTFISWRLLATESQYIGFNIYRSAGGGAAEKLNTSVLNGGTNFTDNSMNNSVDNAYFVKPVVGGTEQDASAAFTLPANHSIEPCVVVPLKSGSSIHLVSVGDLDGDGEYDFVVDRIDVATSNEKIEAYKRDGTFLWSIDLGTGLKLDGIFPGPTVIDVGNWDGITVYDMDGDGKAEVLLKTASGVTFGDGQKLTYNNPNVQFISVIDGMTGSERTRTEIPNNYINVGPLGCSLGIGYLNGQKPSLVGFFKNRNSDGSFNRLMCAWDYDGTALTLKWSTNLLFGASYSKHGADGHQMRIFDCNGDGKDDVGEIAFMVNGEDGSLIYDLGNQGIVHGDRWFAGKLDPDRPGLQGYGIQQDQEDGLIEYYYDAGTGEVLWKHSGIDIYDVGRGETGDIDPRYPGYEVWSFSGLYNGPSNVKIAGTTPYPNFRIWWDGDVLSENLNDGKLEKWDYKSAVVSRLLSTWHYETATGSDRSAPLFYGDIMGDWREEMIYTSSDYSKLIIFTTPDPTNHRLYTLAQNPEYRNCMTVKGYLQSHMVDYYLGAGMNTPPTPPVQTAMCVWKGNTSNNVWNVTTANWLVNETQGQFTQGEDVMFDLSGYPDTIVELNGTLEPSSVKVITPINYSFNGTGTLSGSAGILKSGKGSLTFNTPMNYTDTTRLEEGALFVNSELTQSPVIVFHGAKLGGNGTIAGSVKLMQGAEVSPGKEDSTGILIFSTDLALPTGCKAFYDITNDSTGMLKPSDRIMVNGNLSIIDTMTIAIRKTDDEILPGSYPLIQYTGSFNGDLSKIGVSGLTGRKYTLINNDSILSLKIVAARPASSVTWNGTSDTWDLQTTPAWLLNDAQVTFVAGDSVVFEESGVENSIIKVTDVLPVSNMVVSAQADYVFTGSGNISGSGPLLKNGSGTLSMFTSNSFRGVTAVNEGTLEVNCLADAGENSSIGANTSVDPSAFTLNNAKLVFTGSSSCRTNKGLTLGGQADTVQVLNNAVTMAFKGIVTGSGKLVKTGMGTLHLLENNNTFTGGTVIKEGAIQLNDPGNGLNVEALGNGVVIFEGGTLSMGNTRSYTDFNVPLKVPENQAGTLLADQRCNYGGALTGSGTLNLVLPGSIDRTIFRGDWSAFSGTINFSGVAPMRLASTKGYNKVNFNLASGMTMYFSGGTTSGDNVAQEVHIGSLSGGTNSRLKGENWYVGESNQDGIFKGKIEGNSLTKSGNGKLTLTDTCFYTHATIVNGGTLMMGAKAYITGPLTVNNKALLAGNGRVAGITSINSGAGISPGDGTTGTLTFGADLYLEPGSVTYMDIDVTTGSNDLIKGDGTLNYGGMLYLMRLNESYKEGDSIKLFDAVNYSGAFQSILPTVPADGLQWDTTELSTSGTIKVALATRIAEPDKEKIMVYPNPVSDRLNIQLPAGWASCMVYLYNTEGMMMYKKKYTGTMLHIRMGGFPRGIYHVKVVHDKNTFTQKIIK